MLGPLSTRRLGAWAVLSGLADISEAAWRKRLEAEEEALAKRNERRELPPQKVLYCEAKDGTRLAYSEVGEGPPIVKTDRNPSA